MRHLEDYIELDALLERRPKDVGDFCDSALNADILTEELEEYGPLINRKSFCEFLGIGESTLTGWIKSDRVPRMAKVAYVELIALTKLQAEVKRLRQDADDLKIVQDGETFQVITFEADETGVAIGEIVARDIPNAKTARVLSGSIKAFRLLQETQVVIDHRLETMDNPKYRDFLEDLNTRINKVTIAAFEPKKWRDVFGPFDTHIDLSKLHKIKESIEPNTAVESASNSGDQDDTGASSKRD